MITRSGTFLTGGSGILTKVTCIPTRLPYSPATDGTKTNLATFFVMPIRKGLAYKPSFKIAYTTPGNVPSGEAPVQTIEWNDKNSFARNMDYGGAYQL